MFLPGACRKWKRQEELWLPNPDWINAGYQINFLVPSEPFYKWALRHKDEKVWTAEMLGITE